MKIIRVKYGSERDPFNPLLHVVERSRNDILLPSLSGNPRSLSEAEGSFDERIIEHQG